MAKLYKPIHFQHTADDFWAIYKASVCTIERRRAQFFALLAEGRSEEDVLNITKYAVTTARLMIDRYHTLGLPGLLDFVHTTTRRGTPLSMALFMAAECTVAKLGLAGRVTTDVQQVLGRPAISFRHFAEEFRDVWL